MDWGIKEADERGLEAYIDATDLGMTLYSNYGFIKGAKRELVLPTLGDAVRLNELAEELLPCTWWPMYRPVGGILELGKTILP